MTTTKSKPHVEALIAALNVHELAKVVNNPESNPYNSHTLDDLSHGLLKAADNQPALNMAAKANSTTLAYDMEVARHEFAARGREDKSAKRMAVARQRAARRMEFEEIVESDYTPDPEVMQQAWTVAFHLYPILTKIARSKQQWANRLLGAHAEDIPQIAVERMAMALAKQQRFELPLLAVAAAQLANSDRGIPGDQKVDESEPAERKRIKKARKWLMGMVNNRVMGALDEAYRAAHNGEDNIEVVAAALRTVSGVGGDPMINAFKASRAPAFLGTKFQRPDGINPDALAMGIAAAITERGLDPLVELLLDEDNRRTDGAVEWTKCAEQIFLATPGGFGPYLWDQVLLATQGMDREANARGQAAMKHVRNQFDWLPGLIGTLVDAFDQQFVAWCGGRAQMRSDFDDYLGTVPNDVERQPLHPGLRYASVEEAALAIFEHMTNLTTGNELVAAIEV